MTAVSINNKDIDAIVADARGEEVQSNGEVNDKNLGNDKEVRGKNTTEKESIARTTGANGKDQTPEEVDVEGLTPEERKEFGKRVTKIISKKHAQLKDAEEFAAAQYSERKLAEQRAEVLARELEELKGKKVEPVKEESTKPERKSFANDEDYIEAIADWKTEQKLREREAQAAKEASERRYAELVETAKARVTKAAELVPDYLEVVGAADFEIPPAIASYMQKSEMFAELGYHLAKNPDIVKSLAKMEPDQQLVRIGKIEAILKPFSETTEESESPEKGSGAPGPKEASETAGSVPSKARNAAPVIKPLNANGATVERDVTNMNIRETIADWQKRNNANLHLRKRH